MRLSGTTMPAFGGSRFVFEKVPDGFKPEPFTLAGLTLKPDTPGKGDVTLEVPAQFDSVLDVFAAKVARVAQGLGLSFKVEIDPPIDKTALLTEFTRALNQHLTVGGDRKGPNTRWNGEHLEILVDSHAAIDDSWNALAAMSQKADTNVTADLNQGHLRGYLLAGKFPISVVADPDSEFGQAQVRNMLG